MSDEQNETRVAIVGFGPRGLGALEALAVEMADRQGAVRVDIFEPRPSLGAGPNYDPAQSPLCILNIPLRALEIEPPQFFAGQIGSFAQWSSTPYHPDDFPPRADVGAYLNARFACFMMAETPAISVTHHGLRVTCLTRRDDGWWLTAQGAQHGPFDEVLLTQGQPESAPDPQLKRWDAHAKAHDLALLPAYPANDLIAAAADWTGQTVAIRGLGLSTFDVLRMLTVGSGGRFEEGTYMPSGVEPRQILPFSLTGRPPAPKPGTAEVDRDYDPTTAETRQFDDAVATALASGVDDVLGIICAALVDPAVRILAAFECDYREKDVEAWLKIERDDSGAQDTLVALDALKAGIAVAHGRARPSIGYVVGQIWRKWEPIVRDQFDRGDFDVEIVTAVVGFDEGLKRISAGPPVEASEQLLALTSCGLVSLCTVDDPSIILRSDGWQLVEGDEALTAQVMVDAVLASPNVSNVTDPLVVDVLGAGLVQPLTDGLGVTAKSDGQLVSHDGIVQVGLSALGRLAFGSMIAVDSLHDCFGASTHRWAASAMTRHDRSDFGVKRP